MEHDAKALIAYTKEIYDGPYSENAPDLIIGYDNGYRISWDCATGMVAGPVFEDNVKAWSGDHGVDPRLVPGVFFCTHKIDADQRRTESATAVEEHTSGQPEQDHRQGLRGCCEAEVDGFIDSCRIEPGTLEHLYPEAVASKD